MANPKVCATSDGSPGSDGEEDGEAEAESEDAMEAEGHENGNSVSPSGLEQVARHVALGQLSYLGAVKKRRSGDSQSEIARWRRSPLHQSEPGEEVNLPLHSLISLCKTAPRPDEMCVDAPLNPSSMAEWLEDSMHMGVAVFFMAKHVTGLQVRNWVRAISGGGDPLQIVFLGRSCFYIRCRDYQQKFSLLSRSGAWAENLFGIPLPWEESFDPSSEFSITCPVWILLKNVPIFLLSHLEEALLALGKILYFSKFGPYIHSRSFKVCVLWHLDKAIPTHLRILVFGKESLFIQTIFDPFPLACFKCNRMGHYAKVFPTTTISSDTEHFMAADNTRINSIGVSDSMKETHLQEMPKTEKTELHAIPEPSSDLPGSLPLPLTEICMNVGEGSVTVKTSNPFDVLTNGERMDDNKVDMKSKIQFGGFNGTPSSQGTDTQNVGQRCKKRKLKKKKKNSKGKMVRDKENLDPSLYVKPNEEKKSGNSVEEELSTQEVKNKAEQTTIKKGADLEGELYVELNPDLVENEESTDRAMLEVEGMSKIDTQGKTSAEERDEKVPQQRSSVKTNTEQIRHSHLDCQWYKSFYNDECQQYYIPVDVSETEDDIMITLEIRRGIFMISLLLII